MNERVKQVRQALGLSGEKFGERLGVTRTAISLIETGKNNLSEGNLKSICREFNVNEEWLRHGTGDMFLPANAVSFDELVKKYQVDELESAILRAYFTLDKDIRKSLIEHFKATL